MAVPVSDPRRTESLVQSLKLFLRRGDLRSAQLIVDQLVSEPVTHTVTLGLMAETRARAGMFQEALSLVAAASALDRDNPVPAMMAAEFCLALGDRAAALEHARRASGLQLRSDFHNRLGAVYVHCEQPTEAMGHLRAAVGLEPHNLAFRYNLASAAQMHGLLEEAEQHLDHILLQNPADADAQLARSSIRRQTTKSNHVSEIRSERAKAFEVTAQVALDYALAKELDDLGEPALSMEALSRGSSTFRRSFQYDVRSDVSLLTDLAATVSTPVNRFGFQGDGAIFIFGLPRSGTTLVERILASHPGTSSTGETNLFAAKAVEMVKALAGEQTPNKMEFRAHVDRLDVAELGTRYLQAMEAYTRNPRFVDKTPTNYLYVNLIAAALPAARLVLVRRNPLDVCFAMYRTLFQGHYPFSYDLEEVAIYYNAWDNLMLSYESHFGDRLLVVNYEDVVQDPETTTSSLLHHCGLDWHNGCLSPQNASGPVTTASSAQVRQPIYSSSIGRWRPYQKWLSPLVEGLHGNNPIKTQIQDKFALAHI